MCVRLHVGSLPLLLTHTPPHHTTTPLPTTTTQLFELLCTFVGKRQFQGQLGAGLKDLMYSSIAYLQMSQVRM